MTKIVLLPILLSFSLYAGSSEMATTKTNPGISEEVKHDNSATDPIIDGKDKHGNTVYERVVKITTSDYKVDTFWKRFSWSGDGQETSQKIDISTSGTVRATVEATSLCTLYPELDKQGCSGQKPFLINKEALSSVPNADGTITLMFQKDFNGTNLYTDFDGGVFYPLYVDREEKYYKDNGETSHYGVFHTIFDNFFNNGFFGLFFNKDVVETTDNSESTVDIRQMYISNIVSGIDQKHLLEREGSISTTTFNDNAKQASLIEYVENTDASSGSCNLFFFKFSETNGFCNFFGGLPFIGFFSSTTPSAPSYSVDTIQVDTQNALTSLAGAYADKTAEQMQESVTYQKQSDSNGFLSGIVRNIKCLFFGCAKVNEVEEAMDSYYSFADKPINMSFAVIDTNNALSTNNVIDDFQTFDLMGMHILTGNEHTCQVKESRLGVSWGTETFTPDSDTKIVTTTQTGACIRWNWMGFCLERAPDIVITSEVANTFDSDGMSETVQSNLQIDTDGDDMMTPSEWLVWCDYMVDKYKDNVTTECSGFFIFQSCKEVPADIKEDRYEVLSYTNDTKQGLFLDLKPVKLDLNTKATTLRYKLMNTK